MLTNIINSLNRGNRISQGHIRSIKTLIWCWLLFKSSLSVTRLVPNVADMSKVEMMFWEIVVCFRKYRKSVRRRRLFFDSMLNTKRLGDTSIVIRVLFVVKKWMINKQSSFKFRCWPITINNSNLNFLFISIKYKTNENLFHDINVQLP